MMLPLPPIPRWARIALAAVAAIALLSIVKCGYDRTIVAAHDDAQDSQLARQARRADDRAGVERRADDGRAAQENEQLQKVIEDAPHAPLSDARRAYYRCIRLQQAARKAGDPPPAC